MLGVDALSAFICLYLASASTGPHNLQDFLFHFDISWLVFIILIIN